MYKTSLESEYQIADLQYCKSKEIIVCNLFFIYIRILKYLLRFYKIEM